LDLAEQEKTGFHYTYSVYQAEYSRNLLFTRGGELEQVFQGVVDRTRTRLDVRTLKTIFGAKQRPSRLRRKEAPRCEVVVERPRYDLTVFKVHFGKITAKCYTKGEHVLRIEIIVHNAKALRCGKLLLKLSEIVMRLKAILVRFMSVLRSIDIACIHPAQLDALSTPSQVGQTRLGGVDLTKPRTRAVIEAVMGLAASPQGFSVSQVATHVQVVMGVSDTEYTPRQAAYDLKKLRGKDVVRRIGTSRRYETLPDGLQAMAALLVLREKVIKPVLAGAGKPKLGRPLKHPNPIDVHYTALQTEMRQLFHTIGIAV
jgi:hypothetical protein